MNVLLIAPDSFAVGHEPAIGRRAEELNADMGSGGFLDVRPTKTRDTVAVRSRCEHLFVLICTFTGAAAGRHRPRSRLTPPRNGRRSCITLAEEFSFDGAIAQLGERLHGMQEVAGSSPASSTPRPEPVAVGIDAFRDGLGSWMGRVGAGEEVALGSPGPARVRMLPASVSRPP